MPYKSRDDFNRWRRERRVAARIEKAANKKQRKTPLTSGRRAYLAMVQLVQLRRSARLPHMLARYRKVDPRPLLRAMLIREMKRRSGSSLSKEYNRAKRNVGIQQRLLAKSPGYKKTLMHMSLLRVAVKKCPRQPVESLMERVLKLISVSKLVKVTCKQALDAAIKRLEHQVTSGVHHPADCSEEEKVLRTICHVSYHIVPKASAEKKETLSSLYPLLYGKFMKVAASTGRDQRNEAREADDRIEMQEHEEAEGARPEPADAENVVLEEDVIAGPIAVNEELAREGDELLEQAPEVVNTAGPLGRHFIAFVTYARECDDKCPQMRKADAARMKKTVLKFCELVKKDLVKADAYKNTVLPLLRKWAACFSGVRSLQARFYAVTALISAMMKSEHALSTFDETLVEQMGDAKATKWLPKQPRERIEAKMAAEIQKRQHGEAQLKEKHATELQEFRKQRDDVESELCVVCDRYSAPTVMTRTTAFNVRKFVRPRYANADLAICKKCFRVMREGGDREHPKMPPFALSNGAEFEEVPPELTKLNWIEQSLIQLVRPNRSIACLTDKGGQKTSMRSTGGPLVILPVPTEGTMTHVAETLPSDASLKIIVNPRVGISKIVCLPRVLTALRWLIDHNPLYANVVVNDAFKFSAGTVMLIKDRGAIDATDGEAEDMITLDADHPSLLKHIDKEMVRDVNAAQAEGTAMEQYLQQRNRYEPLKVSEKQIDVRAFPWHFPSGKFGFDHSRESDVKPRMLARWWIANRDRRLATDPQVLAFLQGYFEQRDLLSALGIMARMSRQALEASDFGRRLEGGDAEIEGALHATASNMRGSLAYWDRVRLDLRAHTAIFGPPTFFVTVNPAEKTWPDTLEIYQKVYGAAVNAQNIYEFIAKDPFFFGRVFQGRLRAVLYKILLRPGGGPLGKIAHFFVRIEYQARGTQHAHCLFWCRDAPGIDASDEARLAYVASKVTARMPDPTKEPELHRIISQHQMHYATHSKTCERLYKHKGKTYRGCRFGFPRTVSAKPFVTSSADAFRGMPGAVSRPYGLARTERETLVNDYVPLVSLVWAANTDVQYVWSGAADVITYVSGYVSKHERSSEAKAVADAVKEATSSKEGFKALVGCMKLRQAGMLEVIDCLLGHPLAQFDSGHVFINTNSEDSRSRMLKSKEQRERLADGAPAFKDNMADVYYPQRSERLEGSSYFNTCIYFAAKARAASGDQEDEDGVTAGDDNPFADRFHVDDEQSPFYNHARSGNGPNFPITGCQTKLVLLKKPLVPRLFWPNLEKTNDKAREDYFRRLVMLFIPWRREQNMLPAESESYEAHWTAWLEELQRVSPDAADDIRSVIKHQEALMAQDEETKKTREEKRAVLRALQVDEDVEDGLEVYDRRVDANAHADALRSMNAGQKAVFDSVVGRVDEQAKYDEESKAIESDITLTAAEKRARRTQLGERPEPILKVVVGTAGTGKSFVINAIADAVTLKYTDPAKSATNPAVLIAAPTGLAAVQIGGSTIHTLLGVEVQRGREAEMQPLSPRRLNALRIRFRNCRLLIIDEMSMISSVLLAKVHLRLQEITGKTSLFGGISLIMLGDLLQLPPVMAPQIFEGVKEAQAKRVFGTCLPGVDLFRLFDYGELTENMRQSGDVEFGKLLSRMRVQAMTDDDVSMLKTRVVDRRPGMNKIELGAEIYLELMKEDEEAPMAIFSTNSECAAFNKTVAEKMKLESVTIEAEDSIEMRTRGGATNRFRRPYQRADLSIARDPSAVRRRRGGRAAVGEEEGEVDVREAEANKAAGLEKQLVLAVGGRVMMRRNVDPAAGIVNGATGTLKKLVKAGEDVVALVIRFDGASSDRTIEKVTAQYSISDDELCSRSQFPVQMAFGVTVHKSQGLTLRAAIICTEKFFSPAQGFVAFSRVRRLEDLHLLDLHVAKLTVSKPALEKYNELRTTVGLPVFDTPVRRREQPEQESGGVEPATPIAQGTSSGSRQGGSSSGLRVILSTPSSRGQSSRKRRSVEANEAAPDETPAKHRNASQRRLFVESPEQAEARRAADKAREQRVRARVSDEYADFGKETEHADERLKLHNRGTDCWLIAAINCLSSLRGFKEQYVWEAENRGSAKRQALLDVLLGEEHSVAKLCTLLGNDGEQDDSAGGVQLILQDAVRTSSLLFDMGWQTTVRCANGHEYKPTMESRCMYTLNAQQIDETVQRGSMSDLIQQCELGGERTCRTCGQTNVSASVDWLVHSRFFVVNVIRFTTDRGVRGVRHLAIDPPQPRDGQDIAGCRRRLVAAIEYKDALAGAYGHYVTWVRRSDVAGWEVIDDDKKPDERRKMPNGLAGMQLLVFEDMASA